MRSASSRALVSLYTSPGSSLSLALLRELRRREGRRLAVEEGLGDPGALSGLDAVERGDREGLPVEHGLGLHLGVEIAVGEEPALDRGGARLEGGGVEGVARRERHDAPEVLPSRPELALELDPADDVGPPEIDDHPDVSALDGLRVDHDVGEQAGAVEVADRRSGLLLQ